MELEPKSLDEITFEICDVYDSFIAPKRIWRDNNNKLYLFFRACAAGVKAVLSAVLALKSRFDPMRCSDSDLYSTAKMVGTEPMQGSGSALRVTIANTHPADAKTLAAGTYNYVSVSGMVFSFVLLSDVAFASGSFNVATAVSREKGSYQVGNNSSIKVVRSDGFPIDNSFAFSCEDNSSYLGHPDEDALAFRKRLISDAGRQDHIKELEIKIKNLPSIFECGLKFNPDTMPVEYDGVTLAPLELLITITGVPTDEMAALVVEQMAYSTHQVDPANVVHYHSDMYVNGKYPVYFRYHAHTDFALVVTYQYSSRKLRKEQVEAELNRLLNVYKNSITHVDLVTEADIYSRLAVSGLPGVTVLDVNIMQNGEQQSYLSIPVTRVPNLTGVTYLTVDLDTTEAA
jgi:hypothetical protein